MSGTFLVKLFTGNQLAMFLVPCAVGGFFIGNTLFRARARPWPGPGGCPRRRAERDRRAQGVSRRPANSCSSSGLRPPRIACSSWRVKGFWQYLRGNSEWGQMTRTGFRKA